MRKTAAIGTTELLVPEDLRGVSCTPEIRREASHCAFAKYCKAWLVSFQGRRWFVEWYGYGVFEAGIIKSGPLHGPAGLSITGWGRQHAMTDQEAREWAMTDIMSATAPRNGIAGTRTPTPKLPIRVPAGKLAVAIGTGPNYDYNRGSPEATMPETLVVEIVRDLHEAARVFRSHASTMGSGNVRGGQVYDATGKVVARVSYNGRVWNVGRDGRELNTHPTGFSGASMRCSCGSRR